jgi:hypothetical protein
MATHRSLPGIVESFGDGDSALILDERRSTSDISLMRVLIKGITDDIVTMVSPSSRFSTLLMGISKHSISFIDFSSSSFMVTLAKLEGFLVRFTASLVLGEQKSVALA